MSETTLPSILLCEDDPNLGRLLSDYLKAKGFETTWAKDGVEGLKEFHRGAFDFVILDVMMPRKDGFQVAEEIRQESRHLPILFLTARSTNEDTLEGFKVGADDYMTKPFSMEELLMRILDAPEMMARSALSTTYTLTEVETAEAASEESCAAMEKNSA